VGAEHRVGVCHAGITPRLCRATAWLIFGKCCAPATVGLAPPRSLPLSRRYVSAHKSLRLYRALPSIPAARPPSGPDWVHEIKHEGYRLMARRDPVGTACSLATVTIGHHAIR
jgi:hypothetical protein